MKNTKDHLHKLYNKNEYLKQNILDLSKDGNVTTLWKVENILPYIDQIIMTEKKEKIRFLDVGGGVGLILKIISDYIKGLYGIEVVKYTIDLTPEFLLMQKKNNPDIVKSLHESISKTSLKDKEIDILLMIDVIEHIPEPESALREIARISDYTIFKVPLEKNLISIINNILTFGRSRKNAIKRMGHINYFNFSALSGQIEKNTGAILDYKFTNSFKHYSELGAYQNRPLKSTYNWMAQHFFRISPVITSKIFNDFVMVLVKNR